MNMGKRFGNVLGVIMISMVFLAVGALTAAELPTKAPDEVIIDNQGVKKRLKRPVKFDHKKHVEEFINAEGKKISCTECHHDDKDGKRKVWKEGDPVQRCAACHDPQKKEDNADNLQNAYHKMCKDCHWAVVRARLKKSSEAPISCNKCHA